MRHHAKVVPIGQTVTEIKPFFDFGFFVCFLVLTLAYDLDFQICPLRVMVMICKLAKNQDQRSVG